MALAQCHECNGQISTEAAACPHCGAPTGESSYTTTQSTSKKWKTHKLLSLVTTGGGFAIAVVSKEVGFTIAIIGLVWYLYAAIGAWWHHD